MSGSLYPVAILFAAIFTNNILLTNYLGMCSFLSVSRELKTSVGLGVAVTFVMASTSVLNWLVYNKILIPLELEYLRFIVFIIVIAAFVQIVEMVIERVSETLYAALGIFLPLITVNCAILGVSLFMVIREYSFIESFTFGLGSGIGWFLAILAMAGIRQKLKKARVPKGLEGPGITLIITGMMAMAFMGFSGMINIG
ncbi:NADH:ubiquinone reductase (Na(+)-transporting) subunit E [Sediminispirochaeta smaragdinae]|uniref:Ion-translocating oxidoreductase complex subunit A n=1 Tax=Sediminispirochaeta smaragdinae (strain DSM 11293 / JCM 15392 / SEBR 4228) TaxID=573413 RepID=E1RBL2_SEDSS|nr:Rnf-Nqr domain containing protein [Sediminispirochaeta smaragdinae]ADK79742.1 RnfA-Nqr electron transport subunit [Sediminispirochaeta smaragdinae DSM 11293]